MRENMGLYRGKRKDNGEWVEGGLIRYGWTGQEKYFIIPSYASAFYVYEVDPATIGEYTGLTDKNGMKIFEGDVISCRNNTVKCTIAFEDGAFCFKSMSGKIREGICGWSAKETVVIGNIYDNPELLREGIDAN